MERVETSVFEKIAMGNACERIDGCGECQISLKNTGSLCMKNMSAEIVRLRAEREKNPGVWDGAPEWADEARAFWLCTTIGVNDGKYEHGPVIRREKPKTKAREIAEKWAAGIMDGDRYVTLDKDGLPNLLEAAINEALGGEG